MIISSSAGSFSPKMMDACNAGCVTEAFLKHRYSVLPPLGELTTHACKAGQVASAASTTSQDSIGDAVRETMASLTSNSGPSRSRLYWTLAPIRGTPKAAPPLPRPQSQCLPRWPAANSYTANRNTSLSPDLGRSGRNAVLKMISVETIRAAQPTSIACCWESSPRNPRTISLARMEY